MTSLVGSTEQGTADPARDLRAARAAAWAGTSGRGPAARQRLARAADETLGGLFVEAGGPGLGATLVATGGYGRSELSPGSDLDLLLLVPAAAPPAAVAALADSLWYPLWDAGVAFDHAVRTPAQTRVTASSDLRTLLGLLDARTVVGDPDQLTDLLAVVLADWRALARRRLPQLRDDCRAREARHGTVAHSAEPDLKSSAGGLRDLVALRAVAASWVVERHRGGTTPSRSLLLDARDALHRAAGRRGDRLVRELQQATAEQLGVADRDALARTVAHAGRVVAHATDLTWYAVERELGRRRGPRRLPLRSPLADGVVAHDGEVTLARTARADDDPVLVLRVAAAAARTGMRVAPATLRRLTAAPPLPDPWPPDALDAFLSLLGAGPGLVPVWEALDHAGLVERWLPWWPSVRSLPQRSPVHRHTVDRHLVETVVQASRLARSVARPDLLLLSALLHDVGKGRPGGDHSETGAALVPGLAAHLGLGPDDSHTLTALVRLHLLLPETATRRDPADPATVAAVAEQVTTAQRLELLHALAVADGLAVGEAVWDAWRAGLVDTLVAAVGRVLGGAGHERPPAPAEAVALASGPLPQVRLDDAPAVTTVWLAAPDRAGLIAAVAEVLAHHRLDVRAVGAWTTDRAALQRWTVRERISGTADPALLAADLHRVLAPGRDRPGHDAGAPGSLPAVAPATAGRPTQPASVHVLREPGGLVVEVRAADRPGLFRDAAAALASLGASVAWARAETYGGEAVDVFGLAEPVVAEPDRIARAVARAVEGPARG